MRLKRLWDITNKRMVFVKGPTGQECQVWIDETTNKMYYYDRAQWVEYEQSSENDGKTYGSTWQTIDGDDDMGVYDTNNPTDLFTWESGDEVSYVFKDWNGTVLKEGKVDEGTAPTAPADPTREATAQYTYTFAGWNPTVGPISKKTTFTATYTATVNEYTITWLDDDGVTELDEQTLEYGAIPVYAGETPTKEATAKYTYTFSGWAPAIAPVTGDTAYTARYTATVNQYTVTIQSNNTDYGTVDESSVTVDYGTAISASDNVLTIGSNEITATAGSGYAFSSWGTLPATVTENLSITATFQAEGYLLTFTPRDAANNTQGGGELSSYSYTVIQDGLYFWYNDSYSEDLNIVTDPTDPVEPGEIVFSVTPTPDTGYELHGWSYYDETQERWMDIGYSGTLITGNMQIRCYFGLS